MEKMSPRLPIEESIELINKYTQQLRNSGYGWSQAKEIIVSGIRGFRSRFERRMRENGVYFRTAKSTLRGRVRKKLLEKTTWYKQKKNKNDEKEQSRSTSEETESLHKKRKRKKEIEKKLKELKRKGWKEMEKRMKMESPLKQ